MLLLPFSQLSQEVTEEDRACESHTAQVRRMRATCVGIQQCALTPHVKFDSSSGTGNRRGLAGSDVLLSLISPSFRLFWQSLVKSGD